jgi:hypothetical protein
VTDERTPTARYRRGRRVSFWLPDEEADTLEQLAAALATSTGRATLTRVLRQALDELSVDMFDRREQQVPIVTERRTTVGRRTYDRARLLPPLAEALRRHRST